MTIRRVLNAIKITQLLLSVVLILIPLSSVAALSCEGIFSDVKTQIKIVRIEENILPENIELNAVRLRIDKRPSEITSKKDPRFYSTLLDMLNMMNETVFVTGDRKSIFEKGELRLAAVHKNGQSIEFEYIGDKRGSEWIFRLSKISLIKGNAKGSTIEQNPLSDDGLNLIKKEFIISTRDSESFDGKPSIRNTSVLEKLDLDSWGEKSSNASKLLNFKEGQSAIDGLMGIKKSISVKDANVIEKMIRNQVEIKVPVAISGPVLKEMIKWSEMLQHISRVDLHSAIRSGSTTSVFLKARVKSVIDYAYEKVIKKQLLKAFIFGSVFYGYNYFNDMVVRERSFPNSTMVSDVTIVKSTLTTDNTLAFQKVLNLFSKGNDSLETTVHQMLVSRLTDKKTSQEMAAATEGVQRSISDLVHKEEGQFGSSKFFISDANLKLQPYAEKEFKASLVSADYIIGVFKKQKKIVIISNFKSAITAKNEMAEIIIEKHAHPELFEAIMSKLDITKTLAD